MIELTSEIVYNLSSSFSNHVDFSSSRSISRPILDDSSTARKISICTIATSNFSSISVRNSTPSEATEVAEAAEGSCDLAFDTARERYSTRLWSERGKLREISAFRRKAMRSRNVHVSFSELSKDCGSVGVSRGPNVVLPKQIVLLQRHRFSFQIRLQVRRSSLSPPISRSTRSGGRKCSPRAADQSFRARDTNPTKSCGRIRPSLPALCDTRCSVIHQSHHLYRLSVSHSPINGRKKTHKNIQSSLERLR